MYGIETFVLWHICFFLYMAYEWRGWGGGGGEQGQTTDTAMCGRSIPCFSDIAYTNRYRCIARAARAHIVEHVSGLFYCCFSFQYFI